MFIFQHILFCSICIQTFIVCYCIDDSFQPNSPHVNNMQFASAHNVNKSHVDISKDSNVEVDELDIKKSESDKKNDHALNLPNDLPIIVWWSKHLNFNDNPREINCGGTSCYSTRNRTWLRSKQTRSVLFYGTDLDPEDLPLPKRRSHEWALVHEESPMNNYMLVHGPMINLFNHTSTFRRESDFPLTSQHIPSISYLLDRKPLPLVTKNKLQKEQGLAPILYVQSHCDVASDRDRYVKELMKYIPVDSYGACLNNNQLPPDLRDPVETMASKKFLSFIARYKFHLAFENAICDDYVTEKLFRSVHVGSVPIYRGSPTANDWMPNDHLLILTNDFDSPEALASFIKMLNEDTDSYEAYLKYKEKGLENPLLEKEMKNRKWGQEETNNGDAHNFLSAFECYVCSQISERYFGVEKDYLEKKKSSDKRNHLKCPQPYPSVGEINELPEKDSWKRMAWDEDYWSGYDAARAVNRMIRAGETDPATYEKYLMSIFKESGRA